jgi:CzcA family heavy metal efflux pump
MKETLGRIAVRHAASILFLVIAACAAGVYCWLHMPSAIFPQTNFPRVVILASDGVAPADETEASVTRPIEEAVKSIPGCQTVRSSTGRGAAEIDVFFDWSTDMVRAELQVSSRLAALKQSLPPAAATDVHRMTFSAFPIIGLSLTSATRSPSDLWQIARYTVKPALLRIPGVADVDQLGGRAPEIQVTVDQTKLIAAGLTTADVCDTLTRNAKLIPGGLHEDGYRLFLIGVDGRMRNEDDVRALTLPVRSTDGSASVHIGDVATVARGPEPVNNRVTADGRDAVLLNLYSQPESSTIGIADALKETLKTVRGQIPADVKIGTFYDQSLLVRQSVNGVLEAIAFGLLLSVVILYLFLKNWGTVLVATVAIPVSVLCTVAVMKITGQSFNLMTLGGIAAAIGLVIDDAIVVVESIYGRVASGLGRADAVRVGLAEILEPLFGSTITPVVVFLPLAFLIGVSGVFFRALAITMTVSLLTSLVVAITLTPSLAARLIHPASASRFTHPEDARVGGLFMRSILLIYELAIRLALKHKWFTAALGLLTLAAAAVGYARLPTDFLPPIDEGGFVIDYVAPPGISLTELDRQMRGVEQILRETPEVESFSRRTNAALGYALVEPNTGDYLVKLRPNRKRATEVVRQEIRLKINIAEPTIQWELPGVLTDLIGDLTWEDQPVELKLFSNSTGTLKKMAARAADDISKIPGIVDQSDGLKYTGSSVLFRPRPGDVQRFGVSTEDLGDAVTIATAGKTPATILDGDQVVPVRVIDSKSAAATVEQIGNLPVHAAGAKIVRVSQVADVTRSSGELELHRDDQRREVTITAGFEGRDLGGGMKDVAAAIEKDPALAEGHVEYGGLYEQQQQAFSNLIVVLAVAVGLVFAVAVIEFRSFRAPVAIVFGAVLSSFGIVAAVMITGTTLNIITYLGALIGMGIVHKNGILVIDYVEQLRATGMDLFDAVVLSGRRRLRPVLMTSLAAAVGMLPLAWGIGSGTDLLRPLGVAVIGAVCGSVVLSLVATPTIYFLLAGGSAGPRSEATPG